MGRFLDGLRIHKPLVVVAVSIAGALLGLLMLLPASTMALRCNLAVVQNGLLPMIGAAVAIEKGAAISISHKMRTGALLGAFIGLAGSAVTILVTYLSFVSNPLAFQGWDPAAAINGPAVVLYGDTVLCFALTLVGGAAGVVGVVVETRLQSRSQGL